ncbi:MAG: transketolase [Candidatus Staskawiczbacteria bacterium]|nr:transketolase [Candidatus Staskawiczbacteria bacterium]
MNKYLAIAKEIRRGILLQHFLSKESHVGSALSCADILTVLYFGILRINPKKPLDKNRDRFILSKGHAVSALYATLAQKGFFPKKLLASFCQDGSQLPGHSTKQSVPGVEVSTGGLGHGLPMGVGMALAAKRDKKNHRVFVLMGDGECNEGTTWESAWFSSHHQLDNLVVIVDRNGQQGLGKSQDILRSEPFKDKWIAFGWNAKEINGHNFARIEKTLSALPFKKGKPSVIICNTTKGKDISFMEDRVEWHYKNPNEEQYRAALAELA